MTAPSLPDASQTPQSDPTQFAKWSWREFPWGIALASVVLATALEVLGNDLASIGRSLVEGWIAGLIFLVGFLVAALRLDVERRRATVHIPRTLALVVLLLLALGSFGSLMVAEQVVTDHPLLRFLFAMVAGGLSFTWLQRVRSRVKRVRRFGSIRCSPGAALEKHRRRPLHAAKYIIYLVSPPNSKRILDTATGEVRLGTLRDGTPLVVARGHGPRSLDELVGAATPRARRANWQQVLRGLCPHVCHVSSVWLIGSSGQADSMSEAQLEALPVDSYDGDQLTLLGSRAFLPLLKGILAAYVPEDRIHIHDLDRRTPLDFEDFEALSETVREVIREIRRRDPHVQPREIVIDCTGGQKTASIVGAAITLTDEVRFQYVTNTGEIYLHDLRFDEGPTMS